MTPGDHRNAIYSRDLVGEVPALTAKRGIRAERDLTMSPTGTRSVERVAPNLLTRV